MAVSIGKKITKKGVRMVPSPNPEKKVSMEAMNATRDMRMVDSKKIQNF